MRERIYEIIEVSKENDKVSAVYDSCMLICIVLSMIPLAFKTTNIAFQNIDFFTTIVFMVDYVLRLCTADYKLKQGVISFIKYPFTPMAIIDLLSILPSVTMLNSGFKLFRLFRVIKALRVFRIFKAMRYSKNITVIISVIKESKDALIAVASLALAYIVISALVIFNVEPDSFNSFFDAIYWATVSLTTVGYGDIYPVTIAGRLIAMISSIFGIAVVALPAGIITAGYMRALSEKDKEK